MAGRGREQSLPLFMVPLGLVLLALVGVTSMLLSAASVIAWCDTAPQSVPTRGWWVSPVWLVGISIGLLLAVALPPLFTEEMVPGEGDSMAVEYAPVLLLALIAVLAIIGLARGRERGRIFAILVCAAVIVAQVVNPVHMGHMGQTGVGPIVGLLLALPTLIVLSQTEMNTSAPKASAPQLPEHSS